jgi:hypothetical protein
VTGGLVPDPDKLSPEQARRLLQQAAEKIEVNPTSLDVIRGRIAHRRRRHRIAWWTGGGSIIAAAAAVLTLSMLATSGPTSVSVQPGPPTATPTFTVETPAIVMTTDPPPDPLPAALRRAKSSTTSMAPASTTTTATSQRAAVSRPATLVAGAGGDIDGDGIADPVRVTTTGTVNGSDIQVQADLSRLGTDTALVHGYTAQGAASVLGVTDAFSTGSAAVFVGTGRNDQLGTATATIVVLHGSELEQVQVAPASPYPYLILNYSFNLMQPVDTGTTTTTAGPSVFSANVGMAASMAYGCIGGQLYQDRATQNDGTWIVSRQSYRLTGATLVPSGAPQQWNTLDAPTARAMLMADKCGTVNDAGPGPTG